MKSTAELNLSWIYPDRNTDFLKSYEHKTIWDTYKNIALEAGFLMTLNKPDDITINYNGDSNHVYLKENEISPQNTVFLTSLWALPHQVCDVLNQVTLYSVLETLGYCLPIKPALSYVCTDKIATLVYLQGCSVKTIPTVRIQPGRDEPLKYYKQALRHFRYPMILKPAYWGMGIGVTLIRDDEDLQSALGLLRGSETAVVIQPYLGENVSDFRVYTVNGKVRSVMQRVPSKRDSRTSNLASGGKAIYTELPAELIDGVEFIFRKLPLTYLCMDFLFDGENFWLSEIEPDGAITKPGTREIEVIQHDIIYDRFTSYKKLLLSQI